MYQQNSERKYKQSWIRKQLTKLAFFILRKEVDTMAVVYATLIIKGKKTIKQVPAVIVEKVKEILIEMDLPELAE